jgi:hypothetical protein
MVTGLIGIALSAAVAMYHGLAYRRDRRNLEMSNQPSRGPSRIASTMFGASSVGRSMRPSSLD